MENGEMVEKYFRNLKKNIYKSDDHCTWNEKN